MNLKLIVALIITVAISQVPKVQAQPQPGSVRFICIPNGNGQFATVGQKGVGKQVPLIIWTIDGSRYFGQQYPPQKRCEIVSQKLDAAVQVNGGSMRNLLLTHGPVNGETVICVLGPNQSQCNPSNMLFTLKPSNARRAGDILGQIISTSRYGSSAGVVYETTSQTYVSLETWENQNFSTNNASPNTSNTSPEVTPSTPVPDNQPNQPNSNPANENDWSL